jgi:hypothetical protein
VALYQNLQLFEYINRNSTKKKLKTDRMESKMDGKERDKSKIISASKQP